MNSFDNSSWQDKPERVVSFFEFYFKYIYKILYDKRSDAAIASHMWENLIIDDLVSDG